jgi:hypothetical protein
MRMARKRHKAEEIVAKLRQVEVLTAQGRPVGDGTTTQSGRSHHCVINRLHQRFYSGRLRNPTSFAGHPSASFKPNYQLT